MTSDRSARRLGLGLIAALAFLPNGTGAADLVFFEDGRALRVNAFAFSDGTARLSLENGGQITVPAEIVTSIERASAVADELAEPLPVEEVEVLARELAGESWREAAGTYADVIAAAADRHGLPRELLAAVAKVESNFDPYAVSPKGACGILQLMPATARRFGVRNLFDATQNVEGGARYLRWLLDRFEGDPRLALAAYNAGEGAVDRHRGVPPYRETRSYVVKVLDKAGVAGADQ